MIAFWLGYESVISTRRYADPDIAVTKRALGHMKSQDTNRQRIRKSGTGHAAIANAETMQRTPRLMMGLAIAF